MYVLLALCMLSFLVFSSKQLWLCSVPFQFGYISTTVVPLSIIESMNSLCTESTARDTPHHFAHFSFSASLRYESVKYSKIAICSYSKHQDYLYNETRMVHTSNIQDMECSRVDQTREYFTTSPSAYKFG